MAIAIVGVAGVLAFSVSARTREFGIRLAIGSEPRQILMGVVREGALMALLGVGVGAAGGYGLAVVDPSTGAARTTVGVRFDPDEVVPFGRSTVSADGGRVYLFVTAIGRRQEFP